jgi:O-acetyl-ADP-ribose deacetylase (regulator of RNase III)
MGIPIDASSSIADARTIPSPSGPRIEYNPNQARERVRFSIAHELAHLMFDDVSKHTRNRGGTPEIKDDWQLEMLCNLAASEFVMPIGSMPSKENVPSIENLMIERRKFDVSAEAFLIRVAKTSIQPIGMFCASPISEHRGRPKYRIDYFVPSLTSPPVNLVGLTLPKDSAVSNCTAIGYTEHANENWVNGNSLAIEFVGIPGYPGANLPRVAGLIRFESERRDRHPIRYVHGNALEPRGDGMRVVCQLVNDRARTWGGGIARSAARVFPTAQVEFASWISGIPWDTRLGEAHFSTEKNGIVVASLVAQAGFGKSELPRIRYSALECCLRTVAEFALINHASIHMPRIGTGTAGASWEAVEEIVDYCLVKKGLSVTVYDLPPKRKQLGLFD